MEGRLGEAEQQEAGKQLGDENLGDSAGRGWLGWKWKREWG